MATASERFETTKKVKTISGIVLATLVLSTIALAVFEIYSFVVALGLAALIAIAWCVYDDASKEIDSAPYKNERNVLSLYCNEIEDNGFDASLYRKTIASYREKMKDLWNNPDKYRYLNREIE